MSKPEHNRVLNRLGARELSPEEVDAVSAGLAFHTNVCSIDPLTGARDGDACAI